MALIILRKRHQRHNRPAVELRWSDCRPCRGTGRVAGRLCLACWGVGRRVEKYDAAGELISPKRLGIRDLLEVVNRG